MLREVQEREEGGAVRRPIIYLWILVVFCLGALEMISTGDCLIALVLGLISYQIEERP